MSLLVTLGFGNSDISSTGISAINVLSPTSIQVVFAQAMTIDSEYSDVTNYIVKDTGTGNRNLVPTAITVVDNLHVTLTIPEMKTGESYALRASNLTAADSSPLVPPGNFFAFTGAGSAPVVTPVSPTAGATGVASDVWVTIDITDADSGVNSATIDVTLGGEDAVVNGVVQAGYHGSISPITNGFEVMLRRDLGLTFNAIVNMSVDATDNAGNTV